jgi:hypothetical protein
MVVERAEVVGVLPGLNFQPHRHCEKGNQKKTASVDFRRRFRTERRRDRGF